MQKPRANLYVHIESDSGDFVNKLLKVSMVLSSGAEFTHQGVVDFVDNQVDPNTGTIKMRAVIANPDKTQRPGQFVTAKVTLADNHKVVLVPAKAVAQDEGGHYVYVVDKDDKVERRSVKIGPEYKASYVVEGGIQPGEQLVAVGLQKVHAGAKVEVVETATSGSEKPDEDKTGAGNKGTGSKGTGNKGTGNKGTGNKGTAPSGQEPNAQKG